MTTELPPVGTIVRLRHEGVLAVAVPVEWGRSKTIPADELRLTRILEPNPYLQRNINSNGGWYVGRNYGWTDVNEDEIPDEILALAMRCLLDSSFVPFVSED
jgi:hypothetical protein